MGDPRMFDDKISRFGGYSQVDLSTFRFIPGMIEAE